MSTSTSPDTMDSQTARSSNQSIEETRRFCLCNEERWPFSKVRRYILRKQRRNCPDCHEPFRYITIKDKPITLYRYLFCSGWHGFSLIINSFLQFWLLFYIAFLAIVDYQLSGEKIAMENIFSKSSTDIRYVFITLTIIFIMSSTYATIKTILQQSMEFLIRTGYKLIIDVQLARY